MRGRKQIRYGFGWRECRDDYYTKLFKAFKTACIILFFFYASWGVAELIKHATNIY